MRSWTIIAVLCLAACASPPATPTPRAATLLPRPEEPAATPSAPPATPIIIASPTPSATPVTHVVAQGETLIGLAVKYGISLEALQQANPSVLPEALSIGTALIIPLAADAPSAAAGAQPTPMPVALSAPTCHGLTNGSLYCFVEARNPGREPLEAVSARVTLAGADGLPLAEALAQPALDRLPAGEAIPLVAFFPDAPAGVAAVGAAPVTALPLTDVSGRFGPLELTVDRAELDRAVPVVAGSVRNPTADAPVTARLALAVFDDAGAVIGCTWLFLETPLAPGEARAFEITAPLVGRGPAAEYRVWAEGRP